ncbi:hypothetical protein Glove_464g8 [Diversispora epigaea]|uniref:Uncharacterized protein n=1 Tax=Diversispora epigaea TaxID=1348612 RepID=A0A397GM94_9GLOM|nr:hypothetical protein Glove_464g8 [Diversispora epigaea]
MSYYSRLDENERYRICLIPISQLTQLVEKKRDVGIYAAGGLFAIGWWFFIDAVALSATKKDLPQDSPVIKFEDWLCGIFSTLGMIIVCSISKSGVFHSTRERTFLFIGFALMAGGLAGSATILIIKYIVPEAETYIYFGVAVVVQNFFIMLSSVLLWIAQSTENDNNGFYI